MRILFWYQAIVVTAAIIVFQSCNDNTSAGAPPAVPGPPAVAAITIQSITPAVVSTEGGTTVVIKGTGFLPGSTVLFNHHPAGIVTRVSDSEIRAVAPSMLGTRGDVDVQVIAHGTSGDRSATAEHLFSYYSSNVVFGTNTVAPELGAGYNIMLPIDLMGDGEMSLIGADKITSPKTTKFDRLFLDATTQKFQKTNLASINDWISTMVSADLNGDGKNDLVAGTEEGIVFVFLNDGTGQLHSPTSINVGANYLNSLFPGDFDQDGLTDIGVLVGTSVTTLMNRGEDGFKVSKLSNAGTNAMFGVTFDYNHDGSSDVLVATDHITNILLSNKDGTFQPIFWSATIPKVMDMKVTDMNGDQKPDLVLLTWGLTPTLLVVLNQDNTLQPLFPISVPSGTYFLRLDDINGDRIPDVIASMLGGRFAVFLGNGDGTTSAAQVFDGPSNGTILTIADVNDDQKPDVLTSFYQGMNPAVGLILNKSQ